MTRIPLSHPGGTGDGIKNKGERNCGIFRDKLRITEMTPHTQPMRGSDSYKGEY